MTISAVSKVGSKAWKAQKARQVRAKKTGKEAGVQLKPEDRQWQSKRRRNLVAARAG